MRAITRGLADPCAWLPILVPVVALLALAAIGVAQAQATPAPVSSGGPDVVSLVGGGGGLLGLGLAVRAWVDSLRQQTAALAVEVERVRGDLAALAAQVSEIRVRCASEHRQDTPRP